MTALGLPLALLLGFVADLVARLLSRRSGVGVRDLWGRVRLAGAPVERASLFEISGLLAALLGSGLAAAAAALGAPGSAVLLYLALALGAVGAATSAWDDERIRAGERLRAVAAEPAFLVALGAGFLRWRAEDVRQVLGAQEVLGSGFEVGPALASAGLGLAAAALILAGAHRLPPALRDGVPAGTVVAATLSRWALAGATALVAAALLAGVDLTSAGLDLDLLVWAGVALGASALIGAVRAVAGELGGARAIAVAGLATALAGGAVALILVAV